MPNPIRSRQNPAQRDGINRLQLASRLQAQKEAVNKYNTILDKHKKFEWVDRVRNPKGLSLDNEDGTHSSHSMAANHSPDGKKIMVYPTVINEGGELRRLEDDEAYHHALKTKESIDFDDLEEAMDFSKNYKAVWNK